MRDNTGVFDPTKTAPALREHDGAKGVIAGDPRFHRKLKEIGDLHDKKQIDYGTSGDPFANVRGSQEWGIPPWIGAMVRANDKMHRLQQFARKGFLANESVKDSLLDLAVYSLIALVLLEEEEERETRKNPSPTNR